MLKKIAPDKWRHFWAGIALGALLQALLWWWLPAHLTGATISAFLMVIAVSYGFEVFSKATGMGRYDVMDAVASIIGGIVGMAMVSVIKLYVLTLFVFSASAQEITKEQYKKDFDYFWTTIKEKYCYWDKKQTDWNKVKSIYAPFVDTVTSKRSFVSLLEKCSMNFTIIMLLYLPTPGSRSGWFLPVLIYGLLIATANPLS